MNKILTPIVSVDHINELIDAGAEEFYLGFYDEEWEKQFGDYREINRMSSFKKGANLYSFDDAMNCVKEIIKKNKQVYVTVNSSSYSNEEMNKIKEYLRKIKEAGATGAIVSTIKEVEYCAKIGLESIASTLCGIYNDYTSKYYKKAGCYHQVLPRDLSLQEIESIVTKNPDIKYEVFMMRNGCPFSDSHCLGFHKRTYGATCGMLKGTQQIICSTRKDFEGRNEVEFNNILYKNFFHLCASCGLCALYRFVKMNIYAYKIVGRNDSPGEVATDVDIIRRNIEIAKKCQSEEEYLLKMLLPANSYVGCKKGLGCYYPEVRFK